MAENRRPLGFFFILLLAGQQVYQVHALRAEDGLDLDIVGLAAEVPESDDGCITKGTIFLANRHCEPAEYCELGNWGCRLMPLFWPDARVAADFGTHSGKALVQSESFAKAGSTWDFLWLKGMLAEMDKAENAISSTKVKDKVVRTLSQEMKEKFTEASITQYHQHLQESEKTLEGLKGSVFDINSIAEASRSQTSLDHFLNNVDQGSKKNSLIGKYLSKLDLRELQKLQREAKAKAKDGEEEFVPTAKDLIPSFPGFEESEIWEAVEQAVKKKKQVETDCHGQDKADCMKVAQEQELVELDQETELPDKSEVEELTAQLLQYLAKTRNITGDHMKEASFASVLQLVEDHHDELQSTEDEAARHAFFVIGSIIAAVATWIATMVIILYIAGCFLLVAVIVYLMVVVLAKKKE